MVITQTECYKQPWLLREIRKAVDAISSRVSNTDRVESRIMNHVGQYLLVNANNIQNKRYIRRLIYQEVHYALHRVRKEQATHLEDLTTSNEEGQAVEYEPVDVLANVASGQLELKETITLLAKDDRRRKMILTEWMNGNTNDSDISSILADTLGGQARSHRIFVQRYRIECRTELTALAI